MKIKGLSPSAYNAYEWCEFKFYLTQILGFEDESGPAATLGHLGHKVLEILSRASINKHPKESKIWNPEYLWNISFNHYYNESPEICEKLDNAKLKKVCKGVFETINGPYSPITDKTISAEQSFFIPIQDKELIIDVGNEKQYFNIRGRIDRVDKLNDNTIEIIDYKTGTRTDYSSKDRSKKDELSLKEEIQPRMYHLAGKHLYPWAENIITTFIYLADGGPVSIPFCDNDVYQTQDMIKKRYFTIKNNENPQKTDQKWRCKAMCGFFKDGTCDSVYKEKDQLGYDFTTEKYITLNYDRKRFKK